MEKEPLGRMRKQLDEAVRVLGSGGVVAFPTDTVYGLGAFLDCDTAIEKVFHIKGRSSQKALPVLIDGLSRLDEIVSEVTPVARELMLKYWPGALTLIFKKSKNIADLVTGGNNTVAVRWPDHPVPVQMIKMSGRLICGTSANLTGHKNLHDAQSVKFQLGNLVDYILDTGPAPSGIESTIIDVSTAMPKLVREGKIDVRIIERIFKSSGGSNE